MLTPSPEPVGRKGTAVLTADDERVLAAALAVVAAMMGALVILTEGRTLHQNLHCCGAQRGARLMADAGAVPLAQGVRKH